jgi:hypothetical protein
MSAFLARTKTFTLEAEETFDAEFAKAYRITSELRTLTVERRRDSRPRRSGTRSPRSLYDGRTLTVLSQKHNATPCSTCRARSTPCSTRSPRTTVFLPLSDLL